MNEDQKKEMRDLAEAIMAEVLPDPESPEFIERLIRKRNELENKYPDIPLEVIRDVFKSGVNFIKELLQEKKEESKT